ncbi:hypothetical protein BU15DRAFT_59145 [Melanogaster broomeanus]|nr:hypothetical protein BU15DRAFT_59145 [Melanogaster broomeanus]
MSQQCKWFVPSIDAGLHSNFLPTQRNVKWNPHAEVKRGLDVYMIQYIRASSVYPSFAARSQSTPPSGASSKPMVCLASSATPSNTLLAAESPVSFSAKLVKLAGGTNGFTTEATSSAGIPSASASSPPRSDILAASPSRPVIPTTGSPAIHPTSTSLVTLPRYKHTTQSSKIAPNVVGKGAPAAMHLHLLHQIPHQLFPVFLTPGAEIREEPSGSTELKSYRATVKKLKNVRGKGILARKR